MSLTQMRIKELRLWDYSLGLSQALQVIDEERQRLNELLKGENYNG